MSTEELNNIILDWKYNFTLKDGNTVTKFGSWLLTTKDGHFAINYDRVAQIIDYEPA